MPLSAADILQSAIDKQGSMNAVAEVTGIHESVLKRIKNGTTKRPHEKTLLKLLEVGME